jgi:hypothetical protein
LVRRTTFIVALITALIGFASLPAAAQSARTFYIDYASGSNSNSGLDKTHPWKTSPYMQTGASCTGSGNAPSYTHAAGDQQIFKGGVTWPAACFQMTITAGGASSAQDYYGVDLSWFSGGSFTRPLFDLAYASLSGGNDAFQLTNGVTHVTIDNFEVAHQLIKVAAGYLFTGAAVHAVTYGGNTVKNGFFHDWATNDNFTASSYGDFGNGCLLGAISLMDSTECSDVNGYVFNGGVKHFVRWGGACENCSEVQNSKFHDVFAGCFSVNSCHDNEFYNVVSDAQTFCNTTGAGCHTQIIEDDGGANFNKWYNNVIHDNTAAVTIFGCTGDSIYNNVIWNSGNFAIMLDTHCSNSTSTSVGSVYNNTVDCSNSAGCFRYFYRSNGTPGILNLQNNHWITNGTPVCTNNVGAGCANPVGGTQSNNITMSTSTARSEGYTYASYYEPTSSTNGTVNAAVNLSALCPSGLGSLCTDRLHVPRLTSWDAGAYKFGSQSPSKVNPPTNLTAIAQ